jgi:tetratricopeptide (TPR) repeat protein
MFLPYISSLFPAGYKLGIFDSHLKCGDCYFAKDMIIEALEEYQKGLQYCRSQFCPERICWANYKIANALQALEDYEQAVKHLNIMKRAATKYELKELLGDAALAAARNHLRLAQTDLAQANLTEAVAVFNGIQNSGKLNEARCVMAMTRAQPLFEVYLDTIFKMDKAKLGENKYLEQLLDWKALRKPFWSIESGGKASVSTTNTEFEVGEFEEDVTSESSGSLDDIDVDSFHFPYANTSLDPIL